MFLFALTLLTFGIASFLLGRRGTSSGSHPFCSRCRRNLHLLSPDTPRCPECGSDILAPNATTIGLRQPAPGPTIFGLLTALAGAALLIVATVRWWPTFDGSPYKPTSMLLVELTSPTSTPRVAHELQRRLQANRLSPADTTRLTDLILKLQADPAARWIPSYGDVFQTAQTSRRLPADQWQKYLQQSMQLSARIRPRVTLGDPLPLELTCRLKAGAQLTALLPATLTPRLTLTLLNHTAPLTLRELPLDSIPIPLAWTALAFPDPAQWPAEARPGPTALTVQVSLTLTDAHAFKATATQTFTLPFELLPPTQPSVTATPAPSEAAERTFLAALHWRLRTPDAPADAPTDAAAPPTVLLDDSHSLGKLFISAPPLTAAFRVILRQGQSEWPLTRFIVHPENAATIPLTLPTNTLSQQPHPGPAEILCLPDPTLATATLDTQQVYGSTIHQPITLK